MLPRAWSKPGGKAQVSGGFRAPEGSPRVGGGGRSLSSSGRLGGCWVTSWAYERVMRAAESRSGTGEMGVRALLRGAFRGRSGAGVRAGLECVKNSVPSRAYGRALVPRIEGARNLTERLTAYLTTCLTRYLTHDLTKAGIRELRVGARGVRTRLEGSCGAGSRPRPAPS